MRSFGTTGRAEGQAGGGRLSARAARLRSAFGAGALVASTLATGSIALAGAGTADSGGGDGAGGACVHRAAPAGAAGRRVAVVVGDGAYAGGVPALPNPARDAGAVAAAVGALGFDVYLSTDGDGAALKRCLDAAYSALDGPGGGGDVALFYYSGHGIQIRDENYLVAVDATAADPARGLVPVQPIVDALQKRAKATLVFLDACRTNPLAAPLAGGQAGLSVSTGRGLARVPGGSTAPGPPSAPAAVQARGLMVAYATSPGAVAADGTGELSPFTGAFARLVATPGYSIQHVMSDVTRAVGDATDYAQTPWMKSSLTGELKLGDGQTLAEARSGSDDHAARSADLLASDGRKGPAIVEALKGLPAAPDAATLALFPKAYLALYSAVQGGGETILPLSPGMTEVAVSPRDRVAVFRLAPDYQSGTLDLWSASEQRVVTRLDVGRGVGSQVFAFSPHGALLAARAGDGTAVFDGTSGARLFEIPGRASILQFSADEGRLLLGDQGGGRFAVVDVATRRPVAAVRAGQLGTDTRGRYLSQVMFAGVDRVCFALIADHDGGTSAFGLFDLAQGRTTRLRVVQKSVQGVMCDPTGRYMLRTFAAGDGDGVEIWDMERDAVSRLEVPGAVVTAMDPGGRSASVLSTAPAATGFYDLATGRRAYPPTVPDGFTIVGARVRDAEGGIGSQDVNFNPWRDWPDEGLYGPALVARALAGLTPAQREEVARDRIGYAAVASVP